MTREEYEKKLSQTPGWAPGWEAILERFEQTYGRGQVQYVDAAQYYEENSPLEGFGAVRTPAGYIHIVTRGLSNIRANADALGSPVSGWGLELTLKWPADAPEDCGAAFHLLGRLASYAQVRRFPFTRYHSFPFRRIIHAPARLPASFAGVMFVPDTQIATMETLHGRVEFLQVVNITAGEVKRLRKCPGLTRQLAFGMAAEDPQMVIHPQRDHDYLD